MQSRPSSGLFLLGTLESRWPPLLRSSRRRAAADAVLDRLFVLAVLAIVASVDLAVTAAFLVARGQGGSPHGAVVDPVAMAALSMGVVLVISAGSLYKIAALREGGRGGRPAPRRAPGESRGGARRPSASCSTSSKRWRNRLGHAGPAGLRPRRGGGDQRIRRRFAPGDAVVAVSRGCLEHLTRDELQGVVAHEFSHLLNGDMRLNIRLMGLLPRDLAPRVDRTDLATNDERLLDRSRRSRTTASRRTTRGSPSSCSVSPWWSSARSASSSAA